MSLLHMLRRTGEFGGEPCEASYTNTPVVYWFDSLLMKNIMILWCTLTINVINMKQMHAIICWRISGSSALGTPMAWINLFFFNLIWGKWENYKGLLLLLILREARKRKCSGMLSNTKWETVHLTTKCTEKLTHLKTFEAVRSVKRLRCWRHAVS